MNTVHHIKELCLACNQCKIACAVAHSVSKDLYSALREPVKPMARLAVKTDKTRTHPVVRKCRHCKSAPCIAVCPTGAIGSDPGSGRVIIDEYKCTNCQKCLMACPFEAISAGESNKPGIERIVALKCDGCHERVLNNGVPACVEACKSGALSFCEMDDAFMEKRRLAAETLLRRHGAFWRYRPDTIRPDN